MSPLTCFDEEEQTSCYWQRTQLLMVADSVNGRHYY